MQHPHAAVDSLQSRVNGRADSLQQTVNSRNSVERTHSPDSIHTSVRLSLTPDSEHLTPSRPSRAKRHLAWEQLELESHGFYAESLHQLAIRFPLLTRMELRICALVKGMLTNWEIADCLHICIETVENHRVNIRRKLGLSPDQNLQRHLLTQK